jgi:hypothetical protein
MAMDPECPGSGLENLLFGAADAPVAYPLLLDYKATDRSPAWKTKVSRPDTRYGAKTSISFGLDFW